MIAFTLFWLPVYRYGLFYGITFLFGYYFLSCVGKLPVLKQYPHLQKLLSVDLDSFVLLLIWAIMLWWRLWHVFLYDWTYYSEHFGEIMNFRDGWMSFIWWVIAVIVMLLIIWKQRKFTWREFLLLGDLILSIVPLGILLGRYANMLNKELYGKVITASASWFWFLQNLWLLHDYWVDKTPTLRINTNIIQSIWEWVIPFLIAQYIIWFQYIKKQIRPWVISWFFFIIYAVVRFFAEYLKDIPATEVYWVLTISQWLVIPFFVWWIWLVIWSKN
jgi:phosphatidylglycerol:prolipoprotein diacylglycerol transferase